MIMDTECEIVLDAMKLLIMACLAGLFVMSGYSVIHYQELDLHQGAAIVCGAVILLAIVCGSLKVFLNYLKKLGGL